MPDNDTTLLLVRDLILGSRISGAANGLGVPVRTVRDPAQLAAMEGSRLLVDLNLAGAIEAASAWKQAAADRVAIGFVSHVDAETAGKAKAAGIDRILARSRFVELLPELLSGTRG